MGAVLLILLLAIGTVVLFTNLGGASLHGDEAIYAAVAQQCSECGACFPLRTWYGSNYLNKPPLMILGQAALFRVFGSSEWVARALAATAGLLTLAVVFLAGRRLGGSAVGILSGLVLLGARGWVLVHGARNGVMDAPVALLGLVALLAWTQARSARVGRPGVPPVAVAAVVTASLVKTAHGLLFATLLCGLAMLVRRRGERIREVLPSALAVLAAAAATEAILLFTLQLLSGGQALPAFLRQTVQRFATGLDSGHLHGPFFYAGVIWRDFGPWLLFAPFAFVGAQRRGTSFATAHLAAWCALLASIASLSVSKLPWYLYPIYPPLALVIAVGAWSLVRMTTLRVVRAGLGLGLAAASAVGLSAIWRQVREPGFRLVSDSVVRALEADPIVTLQVPPPRIEAGMRVWNRWYLQRARRLAEQGRMRQTAEGAREVALTNSPFAHLGAHGGPWRVVAWIPPDHEHGPGVWVLATFPFRVPGAPRPPAVDPGEVLYTDGFESSTTSCWSSQSPSTGDHSPHTRGTPNAGLISPIALGEEGRGRADGYLAPGRVAPPRSHGATTSSSARMGYQVDAVRCTLEFPSRTRERQRESTIR